MLLIIITLASSTYGENSRGRTYIPAFFCRSQAFDFPPSDVGSMSEGGVLIRPLFIFKNQETVLWILNINMGKTCKKHIPQTESLHH